MPGIVEHAASAISMSVDTQAVAGSRHGRFAALSRSGSRPAPAAPT
jgi:hypothetical protein